MAQEAGAENEDSKSLTQVLVQVKLLANLKF
jgi:hypothetical protein